MPKLPVLTGIEVITAFKRAGFEIDRIKGSHHILKKANYTYRLAIPVHGKKPLGSGLLRRLIRDAGLSVEEFVELL